MAQPVKDKGQEFVSNKISGNKDQQGQGGQGGQGEKKSSNPLKRYVCAFRGVNVSVANLILPVLWTRPRRSSPAARASKIFAVHLSYEVERLSLVK